MIDAVTSTVFRVLLTVGDVAELVATIPPTVVVDGRVTVELPGLEITASEPLVVDARRLAADTGVPVGELAGTPGGLVLVWTAHGFRVA